MECYLALKRKEILPHAATWVDLEDIMLSEISQIQKSIYRRIPLRGVKFIQTESRTAGAGEGAGGGGVECCLVGMLFLFTR